MKILFILVVHLNGLPGEVDLFMNSLGKLIVNTVVGFKGNLARGILFMKCSTQLGWLMIHPQI